jgi:hypothetical protein
MTNVARHTREIKSVTDLAKAAFNRRPPAPANWIRIYERDLWCPTPEA